MSRPTSYYGTLVPTGQLINDKLFLTLNGAGISPSNPILLGLGARIALDVNHVVRAVRGSLSRITDFGEQDTRDITGSFVQVSDSRWEIEGAIGGDILGFPNNPTLDYSIPQLFEFTFTAVSKSKLLDQVYQVWVQDGHLYSLQSCNSVGVADCGEITVDSVVNVDLAVVATAAAVASGSCLCSGDALTEDSHTILDGITTSNQLYEAIVGPLFEPINIPGTLAQCLYDEYVAEGGCFWNEYGPGLTLAYFQNYLKDPVLTQLIIPSLDFSTIANNLIDLQLNGTPCAGTYEALAEATANAVANATGNVTVTINCPGSTQEVVIPVTLNATDEDTDEDTAAGACS